MADLAVVSHWYHFVEGLSYSSQEFYDSLDQAVARWQVPDIKVSRTSLAEGGIFSGSREYFRVVRKDHTFDLPKKPDSRRSRWHSLSNFAGSRVSNRSRSDSRHA